MWNPSTCTCECDRSCKTGQYLDYKNCVCRKRIIDDLIEQCTSIVDMAQKIIVLYQVVNHLAILILFYLLYFWCYLFYF